MHSRFFVHIALAVAVIPSLAAVAAAHASPASDAMCRRQGAVAEKLAQARDAGVAQQEAVARAAAEQPDVKRAEIAESAELLYHRFRQMPADQAAHEFMLACMDDAD